MDSNESMHLLRILQLSEVLIRKQIQVGRSKWTTMLFTYLNCLFKSDLISACEIQAIVALQLFPDHIAIPSQRCRIEHTNGLAAKISHFESFFTLQIISVRFSDLSPLEAGWYHDCGSPA